MIYTQHASDYSTDHWRYSGKRRDFRQRSGVCILCGHDCRYLYRVIDQAMGSAIWVGRQCKKRFPARDDQDRLDRDKRLRRIEQRIDHVIESIQHLDRLDERDFQSYIVGYRTWGGFSAKQMVTLDWRFRVHAITVIPKCFRVSFSAKDNAVIEAMPDWQFANLSRYLMPSQRQLCERLRRRRVDG